MRHLLTFFSLVLLPWAVPALAQRADVVEWPSATVVLTKGDTLQGSLAFYRTEEILHLRDTTGASTTFTPVLVSSFEVHAPGQKRQFYTYLWNRGKDYSDYRTPSFFEQLSYGNYALLKREVLRQDIVRQDPFMRPYGTGGFYDGAPQWITSVQELFYLYTPKGTIVALRNPKKDLQRVFASHEKQIRQYVNDNDLRYNRRTDLIRIVNYYNSLTDPNSPKIAPVATP